MIRKDKEKRKIEMINDIKQIEAVLKLEKDMINSELLTDEESSILQAQIKELKLFVSNLIM